jgi:hypothetical protein
MRARSTRLGVNCTKTRKKSCYSVLVGKRSFAARPAGSTEGDWIEPAEMPEHAVIPADRVYTRAPAFFAKHAIGLYLCDERIVLERLGMEHALESLTQVI